MQPRKHCSPFPYVRNTEYSSQSLLASCSWDHTVRTWDVFRYSLFQPHALAVKLVPYHWVPQKCRFSVQKYCASFMPMLDQQGFQSLLASCSWDHTVRTWDVFRCRSQQACRLGLA